MINAQITPAEFEIIQSTLKDTLPPMTQAWVFGSRAKNTAHQGSDLDIAIAHPEDDTPIPNHIMATLRDTFDDSPLPYTVDILDIQTIDDTFHNAVKSHSVIFPLNTPKLRLTNPKTGDPFTGDWEPKKLSDLCKIKTGSKDVNEGNNNGKYPFFTCAKEHSYSNTYSFDTEAILLAGNGNIGNPRYYKGKFEAYQRTYVLHNFSTKMLCTFLLYAIESPLKNKIAKETNIGAMPFIKLGTLTELIIAKPKNIQEQQVIADCLLNLSALIEYQSEKIEALKQHKQGLMQNFFPQVGETVPKIRFKRSDGTDYPDWQVMRLGDVCEIFRGGSPRPISSFLTAENGVNWLKIGDVPVDGKYVNHTTEKIKKEGVSKSRIVEKGDFILSNSMSFGRPYIMNIRACIHDGWLALSKYEKYFNQDFLYYIITTNNVSIQFISMASGSSVKNLSKDLVSNVAVNIPHLDEQKRIAAFFSNLDEVIQYQSKKIEALKQHKQGLMQKLFPKV